MFSFSEYLWKPQLNGLVQTVEQLERGRNVCCYAPTGGGKTVQAIELARWCRYYGQRMSFYSNRKLVTGQTSERFSQFGLEHGVRAAGFDDLLDMDQPIQICSADTEMSRVLKRCEWQIHPADLVVIDEAHIQKSTGMQKLLEEHQAVVPGCQVVALTATPIGISHMVDELVISGSLREYRECKSIVLAQFHSITHPDMKKVKRNVTGEYVMDGKKRKIYTQHIVGDVLSGYEEKNPDRLPTILYAPCVASSRWYTDQFNARGHAWCHIDATEAYINDRRVPLTRAVWDDIRGSIVSGKLHGISNRLKMREGVDIPQIGFGILACPIGSLASYIQTVGRILRYSDETPELVRINDHGGNYHRHGSPNHDRDWRLFWNMRESAVSSHHQNQIERGEAKESIVCPNPKCRAERMTGLRCPACGFEHELSKRRVVHESGRIREVDGDTIRPRKIQNKQDTQDVWRSMYFRFRNTNQTFNQLESFFKREKGYYPPRELKFMPVAINDWGRKVKDVPYEDLR